VRSHDLVRNRPAGHRNAHHVPASAVDRLAYRFRHFVRLAGREANPALAISNRDQRVEGEPASTLHDLGDTVDGDDVLHELAAAVTPSAVAVT
jgi:hypothetical protein